MQYTVPHETMKMVLFNSFALEKTFIASYIIVMVRIEVTRYIDTITLQYQSDGDAFSSNWNAISRFYTRSKKEPVYSIVVIIIVVILQRILKATLRIFHSS